MTADQRLLPAGIADDRSRAFLEVIDRLNQLHLEPLLVRRYQSTLPDVLRHLAYEFNVQDVALFAATDAQRRELIAQAGNLNARRGTPWAVKEMFRRAGFPNVAIREGGLVLRHDGTYAHDGEIRHSGVAGLDDPPALPDTWALFDVLLDVNETQPAVVLSAAFLRALIEPWKPVRSQVGMLSIRPSLDERGLPEPLSIDVQTSLRRYDGTYMYDGTITYDGANTHAVEIL